MKDINQNQKNKQSGYFILELILGLVVVASIVTAAFSYFQHQQKRNKTDMALVHMLQVFPKVARDFCCDGAGLIRTRIQGSKEYFDFQSKLVSDTEDVLEYSLLPNTDSACGGKWAAYFVRQSSMNIVYDIEGCNKVALKRRLDIHSTEQDIEDENKVVIEYQKSGNIYYHKCSSDRASVKALCDFGKNL